MQKRLTSSKQGKRGVQMPCLQLRTAQVIHPGLPCYFLHCGPPPRLAGVTALLTSAPNCCHCPCWAAPPLLLLPFQHRKLCISDGTGFRRQGKGSGISQKSPALWPKVLPPWTTRAWCNSRSHLFLSKRHFLLPNQHLPAAKVPQARQQPYACLWSHWAGRVSNRCCSLVYLVQRGEPTTAPIQHMDNTEVILLA